MFPPWGSQSAARPPLWRSGLRRAAVNDLGEARQTLKAEILNFFLKFSLRRGFLSPPYPPNSARAFRKICAKIFLTCVVFSSHVFIPLEDPLFFLCFFFRPNWPPSRLLNPLEAPLGPQKRPQDQLLPNLARFWGSTWTPKPPQIHPKSMPKRGPFGTSFSDRFLVDFQPQLGPLATPNLLIFLRFFNDF